MLAKVHAIRCPLLEVVLKGNGTAAAARVSDRNVLLEGRGTLNRWLVGLLMLPNCVGSSIAGECALDGTLLGRVACIFHDVVFDERVGSPTVDGQETYTPGARERTREVDGSKAILLVKFGKLKTKVLTCYLPFAILCQQRSPGWY